MFWGEKEIKDYWIFEYLGNLFQADGDQTPDVERRVDMAMTRTDKLRHIWSTEDLSLKLKIPINLLAVPYCHTNVWI